MNTGEEGQMTACSGHLVVLITAHTLYLVLMREKQASAKHYSMGLSPGLLPNGFVSIHHEVK